MKTTALSFEQLDHVSGGHMSADGKTFSIIVWKTADTKYGFSVSSDGSSCTVVAGPNGNGGACTHPV